MEVTNKIIYEKLFEITRMLESLVSYNNPNKSQALENEIRIRKHINVRQVQSFLGKISRPHALTLMKRLGEQNNFNFILGDKSSKRPSVIVYQEAKEKKEQFEKIKELVDTEKTATIARIAEDLHLTLEDNLINIRELMRDFIKFESENGAKYFIKDDNKLCKEI